MKSKLWPKPGSKPQPSNETVPPFPKDWTGSLIDKVASHTGVISDCSFAKEKYGDGLTYPTIDELQESASYWWHADRIQVYGEPLLVSVFATQDSKRGLSEKETQREREREKTSHEHTESFRLFLSDWLAHKGDLQVAEDCTRVLAFVMAFAEAAGYKSKAGVPN